MRAVRRRVCLLLAVLATLASRARANSYYIATNGSDSNNGAFGAPFATFTKAINTASAGDTIFVRGGTYSLASKISIAKSGTAANPYNLFAYNNETPVLSFGSLAVGSSNRGIELNSNYWHLSGLTVQYAGDNGVFVSGSNNTVERCVARQNQDSGFQISTSSGRIPSNNLILNCDSYGNYDTAGTNFGENADGYAVKFRGLGPGNVLSGCRAWNNSDDGYDFWQAENGITVQNCQAFHNGIASTFQGLASYNGDGNGIKLGHDSGTHTLKNMLIWGNPANGIDVNGNATQLEGDPPTIAHGVTILNNTAVGNGKNFNFDENPTTATPSANHILRDNISFNGSVTVQAGNITDHNTWSSGTLAAASGDFVSTTDPMTSNGLYNPLTDRTGATTASFGAGLGIGARQADGSLPDLAGFMRLVAGSHLINMGVDVGLPYVGPAPDLGAFENIASGNAFWGTPGGGSVEPSWNWISGIAPGSSTTANFALASANPYTVFFSSSPTNGAMIVHNEAQLILNLNSNTYTQNSVGTDALTVAPANGNTAMLVISDGTMATNPAAGFSAVIGRDAGSNGAVQVWTGGVWNVGRELRVGQSGTGALIVNSTGAMTVGTPANSAVLSFGYNAGATGSGSLSSAAASLLVNGDEIVGRFGSGSFAQSAGTHTITASLTLAANAGSSGIYTLTGGTLNVPTLIDKGTFNYNGGSLNATTIQLLSGGRINVGVGGNKTLRTASLSIDAASKLDLTDNDLILDATPLDTIAAYIASGYSAGNWNGAGIQSTSAAAIAASTGNTHKTALGYATASSIGVSSFNGQNVDGTDVIVRYTFSGDSNLDGVVNGLDFNALALNFNTSGGFWAQGDFNFDGIVNALDFNAIATNFGLALPSPPALGTLVPEPGSLLLIVVIATAVRRKAHRRRDGR